MLEVGYVLAVDVDLDPGGLAFDAGGGTCRWDGRMS